MEPTVDPTIPGSEPGHTRNDGAFERSRASRHLRELAYARLETGGNEDLLTWTRVWVSRDSRLNVFSARTRDFAVLTNYRLMLWSTGFITRRPRRRVLTDRLADLTVDDLGRTPLRTLRVRAFARRALRFQFGTSAADRSFAQRLVDEVAAAHAGVAKPPFSNEPDQGARWRP